MMLLENPVIINRHLEARHSLMTIVNSMSLLLQYVQSSCFPHLWLPELWRGVIMMFGSLKEMGFDDRVIT